MFDLNDFDETYRGPWEWDVKRLAASFVVASRRERLPRGDRSRHGARRRAGSTGTGSGAMPGCARCRSGTPPSRSRRSSSASNSARERVDLDVSIEEARSRGPPAGARQAVDQGARAAAGSSATDRRCWSDFRTTIQVATTLPALYRAYVRSLRPGSTRPRREASAAGRGAQGRRGRERRDALLCRPVRGTCRRSADPAGQGGRPIRPLAVRPRTPLLDTRASASSAASGSCRPSPTASSGGPSRR